MSVREEYTLHLWMFKLKSFRPMILHERFIHRWTFPFQIKLPPLKCLLMNVQSWGSVKYASSSARVASQEPPSNQSWVWNDAQWVGVHVVWSRLVSFPRSAYCVLPTLGRLVKDASYLWGSGWLTLCFLLCVSDARLKIKHPNIIPLMFRIFGKMTWKCGVC